LSKPSRHRRAHAAVGRNQLVFLISSILAASAAAAQTAPPTTAAPSGALEEVIVTAQKHEQNLQDVPISVQAFDTKHLEQLQVTSFDGYAKYLPSLSYQNYGPGQAQLYVRGVTNGGDGLHVGSQPLVGVYVDEMPVTTIANNLDVHIYDIARIENLSGPQGTLFGSSSMAGVLRIITNKPSTTGFEAGYDLTANTYTAGAPGGKIEGFVNVPLSDAVAIRLVGFTEHDGGYINNVLGPAETYPTSGIVRTNAGLTKKNFNDVQTSGGRAAMKIDFNKTWTVTPMVMAQNQDSKGTFAFTPALGDLNVAQYFPNENQDNWWQASLTVEGKISDFDVLYAGGYLARNVHTRADYSDYAYFYDTYYSQSTTGPGYFGDNFRDNNGNLISPAQYTLSTNNYKKYSHELRFSTPKDWKLHGVLGLFLQRQYNYARDEYRVDGLADALSITNLPGVLYLNSQRRTDRDRAIFTDWTYDATDKLALTGGLRVFSFDNTVYGFFGYNGQNVGNGGPPHGSGEQLCSAGTATTDPIWPCVNIDSRQTKTGTTHRLNATYKFDPDHMLYATWSTGFRPGGINRVRTFPGYQPDYLTNVEIGWKTEWFDRRVRWNGAVFDEEWKDAQFGITGQNGITEIVNTGAARIKGIESDVTWRVTDGFTLTASATYLDAKMIENACNFPSPSGKCSEPYTPPPTPADPTPTPEPNFLLAATGSRLPVSAKLKGNVIARYEFKVGEAEAHVQAAMVAQTNVGPNLQQSYNAITGQQPGYQSLDLAGGWKRGKWEAELFLQNAFDKRGESIRYNECNPSVCTLTYVLPIAPRLVGVTVGQKF
jgi:iron complex outermembrane receptor protein